VPVKVEVQKIGPRRLKINSSDEKGFINDGSKIVDDTLPWQIYRVLERDRNAPDEDEIVLDRDWMGSVSGFVWVVPPAEGSGRDPCIGVYQTVIGF
jgi:hypothetical protein